jgi:hypothetical protein
MSAANPGSNAYIEISSRDSRAALIPGYGVCAALVAGYGTCAALISGYGIQSASATRVP